jgi:plastocyanin
MSGEIRVVPKDSRIPPQSEVDAAAKQKLGSFVDETLITHARTYKPFERARAGSFPWPARASFETHRGVVKVLEFVPFTLKAKVDERVRWSLHGAHTIAFDAPENAKPPSVRILSTGETELKADAVNESRSPEPPVGAPSKPTVLEAGPYSEGFLSSGMLYSPTQGLITYSLRFSDPGSYRYECLLHPRMSGLVIVSV